MRMPFERTRSIAKTHAFLAERACHTGVPERIRQYTPFLLRHFPTENEVLTAGRIEEYARN